MLVSIVVHELALGPVAPKDMEPVMYNKWVLWQAQAGPCLLQVKVL